MFRRCLAFLSGLSIVFFLENHQQAEAVLASVILAIGLVIFLNHHPRFKKFKAQLSTLYFLAAGFLWGTIHVLFWLQTTPTLISQPQISQLNGYICSIPVSQPDNGFVAKKNSDNTTEDSLTSPYLKVNFQFCVNQFDSQTLSFYQKNKIKLSAYHLLPSEANQLTGGSYWMFKAKLKPIHGRLNPGGFDYEKWLMSEGYIATGYVKTRQQIDNKNSINASYHRFRQSLYQQLTEVVAKNSTNGMLFALAMGERGAISAEQWQVVKNSGTSHLLAISGLHIGIAALWSYHFFLFLFSRLNFINRYFPAQTLAQVMSLLAATAITLISGLGYPAQRALIMLLVYFMSSWSGRHLSLVNLLSSSVFIILVVQPFAILTVSFWLSVVAVAIIVLLTSYKQKLSSTKYKGLKNWLRLNWYLFLGLFPVTWAVFDSISMVSFFANIILIPLTSFLTTPIIYIGMISLIFSDTFAGWIFDVASFLIEISFWIQSHFSEINQLLSVSALPLNLFMLVGVATLILLSPLKLPGKFIIFPIFILSLLYFLQPKSNQPFKMVVFDIGQGLAIHISVAGKNLIYDTGYGNASFSMAEFTLAPYLKRQGIKNIDRLVISHNDADHAGGFDALKESFSIDELSYGKEDINYSNNTFTSSNCHEAAEWQWGEVTFKFLPHLNKIYRSGNNSSCVLSINIKGNKILLTGDIEKMAERALLENNDLTGYHAVVVAHHGSATSSTLPFVDAVKPDFAIYSTGYGNQWSFPRGEITARFEAVGAANFITHQHGAITLQLNSTNSLEVSTERANRTHFWQLQAE